MEATVRRIKKSKENKKKIEDETILKKNKKKIK